MVAIDWHSPTRLPAAWCQQLLLLPTRTALLPAVESAWLEHCRARFDARARILAVLGLGLALLSWAVNGHLSLALALVPLSTVILPAVLPRRVLLTALVALATAAGCFLLFRQQWASPHALTAVVCCGLSAALSVWFGHILFLVSRENYYQAHELLQIGRSFQSRVEARTLELRRLVRHIETTRETERTRIARELHDELGQELSALRYELRFTRKRYEKEPGEIATNLEEMEELLRRTAVTTRNLVSELRPKVLDDLGLPAAVQWLAERTKARGNLDLRILIASELPPLDGRIATVAFRVLQEALTNLVRHAQARRAEVEVLAAEGRLELRVTDDGIGLRAAQARDNRSGGHVGLIGMRERALAVGGKVEIREPQSGGTEVRAWLPLEPPPEDALD